MRDGGMGGGGKEEEGSDALCLCMSSNSIQGEDCFSPCRSRWNQCLLPPCGTLPSPPNTIFLAVSSPRPSLPPTQIACRTPPFPPSPWNPPPPHLTSHPQGPYLTAVMHALKHPSCSVNGVLLGKVERPSPPTHPHNLLSNSNHRLTTPSNAGREAP